MYSENNRRSATQRANDEFLRRMLGGELTGDGFPVAKLSPEPPLHSERSASVNRIACDGTPRPNNNVAIADKSCPTSIPAPSIAMVYAPKQCWRKLLDPAQGLSKGSIFSELILPLEAAPNSFKEVKARRPM